MIDPAPNSDPEYGDLFPPGAQRTRLVRNASEIAAGLIRQAIIEGRLCPGTPLREERLATDIGISRTPIREALLILQTEGLVEAVPKRGSVVRSYTLSEITDIFEARAILEAHVASRAAQTRTEADLERLRDSCERLAMLIASDDLAALVHENHAFHEVILNASQSKSFKQLVGVVTHLPLIYRSYYWGSDAHKAFGLHYHQRITRAIEIGDSGRARALMNEHILEALDVLVAHLDAQAATGAISKPSTE
jgi:DNA-binding GntR family transcriptional regulator